MNESPFGGSAAAAAGAEQGRTMPFLVVVLLPLVLHDMVNETAFDDNAAVAGAEQGGTALLCW